MRPILLFLLAIGLSVAQVQAAEMALGTKFKKNTVPDMRPFSTCFGSVQECPFPHCAECDEDTGDCVCNSCCVAAPKK
jgi:hypothetical protein